MRTRRLTILGFIVAAALVVVPAADAAPTTFDVNVNLGVGANLPDMSPGDGVCATTAAQCTLRAAIQESNATSSGAPYTIGFFVPSLAIATNLPAITRSGTFVDGCNVGRTDPPLSAPKPPALISPCTDLLKTGTTTNGLTVNGASGTVIQGLTFRNFPVAVHLAGADSTRVSGNRFGIQVNGNFNVAEANGVGVSVTGKTSPADPAKGNIIGGPAPNTAGACDTYCNMIVNSSGPGIDLVGTPANGETPAGGNAGNTSEGTTIAGNWIGVRDATGSGLPNGTAVKIGDAQETLIGGPDAGDANVIAGNDAGVDQGTGATAVTLLGGSYGVSPDTNTSVPNGQWNARLHGGGFGAGPFIQGVTFGPAPIGLELDGSNANVLGSAFLSPQNGATFATAAIKIGPGGDRAFIGSNTGSTPPLCFASVTGTCNVIGDTAPGAPGIWINGADDTSILRTSIGFLPAAPLGGPPIRIDGAATGAIIGDDDDAGLQNRLVRQSGPAVEIGGTASKIVIAANAGLSVGQFNQPGGLFTELLPDPGPGNSGPVNGGIQAPVITQASADGVGGTGIPGATIRVIVQQRAPVNGDPDPGLSEGETYPSTPSVATAGDSGVWGITFVAPLKVGNKLLASQTTADGSSEYATPQAATATNPPPLVTFTSGPPTVVATAVRSATFAFSSNKAGSSFRCSLDAGTFVPCTSPYTVNGLETGGHQLQVKATDPIGKQGPPASRNWSILFPVAPPAGPPVFAAGAVRFASVVSLPSAKSCISKRSMRITVRAPKGAKVKAVVIRTAGKKVASANSARTIPISLKGLRRGTFVVKVEVTLADSRVIKGSRTYKTCAKKAANKKARR